MHLLQHIDTGVGGGEHANLYDSALVSVVALNAFNNLETPRYIAASCRHTVQTPITDGVFCILVVSVTLYLCYSKG